MAELKLLIRPGVNKQLTPTLNEGGWSDGDNARFKDGLGQKCNGFAWVTPTEFLGFCRGLHAAVQLDGQSWVALGTNQRLYLFQGGAYFDITPLRLTTNPMGADSFTAVSGDSLVTVADVASDTLPGDAVLFSDVTSGHGLTIDGYYTVVTVNSIDSYVIDAGTPATSSGTFGGSGAIAEYLISPGAASAGTGFGWGVGPWGGSTWGTPRDIGLVVLMLRLWSVDHWGEDLIACPRGGGYYQWVAADGPGVHAVQISGAPTLSNWAMVGAPERHAIAYGTESGGVQDPMLMRWSDVENLSDWVATATNSAGSFRLNGGTKIQSSLRTANEILVFTDAALFSQQFVGLSYVYTFRQLGSNCGLIGPNAAASLNGVTCWMDTQNFHIYTGTVRTLPCDVWDYVFNNLNRTQVDKIYATTIEFFNEIRWYYPSNTGDENDLYVAVCLDDFKWSIGRRARTAQISAGIFQYPLATTTDFHLSYEEFGLNANGAALESRLRTGFMDIGDGTDIAYVDRIIPDFTLSGSLDIYVIGRMYPGGVEVTKGPFTITPTTRWISPRLRMRQIAFEFVATEVDAFYRMGAVRVNASPAGRN